MQVLDGQLEKGKWLVGDEFTLVECDSAACRGAAVKSSSSSTGTCLPRTIPISALPMSCTAGPQASGLRCRYQRIGVLRDPLIDAETGAIVDVRAAISF